MPPIFPIFLPHFRLYAVASLHVCVLPYKYREILEMLPKLMELCEIMGSRRRPVHLKSVHCFAPFCQIRTLLCPFFVKSVHCFAPFLSNPYIALPLFVKSVHCFAPFCQNGAKSGFEMCFDIGSQHLECWGQNTSRIQNKEVYATLCLQCCGAEISGRPCPSSNHS